MGEARASLATSIGFADCQTAGTTSEVRILSWAFRLHLGQDRNGRAPLVAGHERRDRSIFWTVYRVADVLGGTCSWPRSESAKLEAIRVLGFYWAQVLIAILQRL